MVVSVIRAVESTAGIRIHHDPIVLAGFMLGLVVLFFLYYLRKFPDILGLFKFSPNQLLYGAGTIAAVFLSSSALIWLAAQRHGNIVELAGLSRVSLSMIVPVLIAPVIEEVFFRGVLLRVFLAYYSAPAAIVFGGLAFAAVHLAPMPGESRVQLLSFFVAQWCEGILLCAVTYRTKNLSYAWGFHIVNNLLAFLGV